MGPSCFIHQTEFSATRSHAIFSRFVDVVSHHIQHYILVDNAKQDTFDNLGRIFCFIPCQGSMMNREKLRLTEGRNVVK